MACKTKYCKKPHTKNSKYCHSCKQEKKKQKDHVKYCYWTLRNNAKRRGKIFELTLNEFREFAHKTNYMVGKGKQKESYHIDRINENGPYSVNNIQILTNTENVRKFLRYEYDQNGVPANFTTQQIKPDTEQYPF